MIMWFFFFCFFFWWNLGLNPESLLTTELHPQPWWCDFCSWFYLCAVLRLLSCVYWAILVFLEWNQLDHVFFNVLFSLICKYFIDDFCVYDEVHWCLVFFIVFLSDFWCQCKYWLYRMSLETFFVFLWNTFEEHWCSLKVW
jgi:hypothetical protein